MRTMKQNTIYLDVRRNAFLHFGNQEVSSKRFQEALTGFFHTGFTVRCAGCVGVHSTLRPIATPLHVNFIDKISLLYTVSNLLYT